MILVTVTHHSDTSDIQNNAHDTFTLYINTHKYSVMLQCYQHQGRSQDFTNVEVKQPPTPTTTDSFEGKNSVHLKMFPFLK